MSPVRLALVFALTISSAWSYPRYEVIDLGKFSASSLNNAGQIAGSIWKSDSDVSDVAIWFNGTVTDLGTLRGGESYSNAINASGLVVGTAYVPLDEESVATRAFLNDHGTIQDLGDLGGGYAEASGINATGQIVGDSYTVSGAKHAFYYSSGSMVDLGTLDGKSDSTSSAEAINDRGQIAMNSTPPNGKTAAIRRDADGMHYLGTLGGAWSQAKDINASGWVVGSSERSYGDFRAFIHDGTGMRSIRMPYSDFYLGGSNYASAINASGVVVGSAVTSTYQYRAFVCYDGRSSYVLNSRTNAPGWIFENAGDINDEGWIFGSGTYYGADHYFLLKPLTPPRLAVTHREYINDGTRIRLKGTCKGPVTKVRYSHFVSAHVSTGGHKARGTKKWSFESDLRRGRNFFEIEAVGSSGETTIRIPVVRHR